VSDDECRSVVFVRDDRRHVRRVIVQINPRERTAALADAARLRPQHAVAGARKPFCDRIEVGRAAAEGGKQNNNASLPISLRQDLDAHVTVRNDAMVCNDASGRRLR
jgi:hypothetical protein